MIDDVTVTRRSVLAAGAVGAGAVALAACSSGSSKNDTSGTSGTSGTPAASAPLAKLDDIKVGEAVSAKLPDGTAAIVARPTADTAAAFSAKCTHMGCTVKPAGAELDCPCHGSKYNAVTGEVINGPATRPLPKIDVQVSNGQVVTGAASG